MNDLNTINRLNNNAAAQAKAQQRGKYLVAEYAGLSAVNYTGFETEAEAKQVIETINAKGAGSTAKLFVNN